jgi:HEAT repeat protein
MKRRTFLATSFGSILALQNGGTLAQQAPTGKQRLIQNCIHLLGPCETRGTCFRRYEAPEAARDILSAIGEPATSALCNVLLQDKSSWRRTLAVEALVEMADRKAIPALIQALRSDDYGIRSSAAKALGKRKAREAVEVLIETLNLRDQEDTLHYAYLAHSAATALGSIGDERAILPLLKQIGSRDAVSHSLPGGTVYEVLNESVIKALASFGTRVRETLVEAWYVQEDAGKRDILQVLGEIGDPKSVWFLYKGLRNAKSTEERFQFAIALGRCGDSRATPFLLPLLKPTLDDQLRRSYQREALKSLKVIKDATTLEPLLAFVNENTDSKEGIEALSALDPPQLAPMLIRTLNNPNESWQARQTAADVLGERNERHALPALKARLSETGPNAEIIRFAAMVAIGRMEPESITEHLRSEKDPDLIDYIRAAGTLKMSSAAPLIYGYVKNSDMWIPQFALDALGEIAPASYIPRLEPLLYQKEILKAGYAAQAIVAIRNRQQTQN